MKKQQLIIIAPTAPPGVCGVSDYAYHTAEALKEYYEFIKMGVEDIPERSTESKPEPVSIDSWEKVLGHSTRKYTETDVLLNYTPLSYSKTGYPTKLITYMRWFKLSGKNKRLFVFLHETWDDSPGLKLHHKLRNKIVKHAMLQLCKIADGITVVTKEQQQRIEALIPGKSIHISPIGSNILPVNKISGLESNRQKGKWIIFGLAHTRYWTLQKHLTVLKDLYDKGVLKQLIVIGPIENTYAQKEAALAEKHFGPGFLKQLGVLSSEEVSEQMLGAEAALIGQTADSLNKSGTFSALAAHGVPVIGDVSATLSEPPGSAIFHPSEFKTDNNVIFTPDGEKRRVQLYNWFWLTRSWEALALDMRNWMMSN